MTKRNFFENISQFNKNGGIAMSNISEALLAIVKEKKRLGQKITQVELARKMGCHQSFISGMLKGDKRINADMLEKLCAALEIKLSDLENWNPELAEIRLSHGSGKLAPPELAKAQAKLGKLYEVNKPAFDGVIGTIDVWLKQSKEPESAPLPELEKKAKAS